MSAQIIQFHQMTRPNQLPGMDAIHPRLQDEYAPQCEVMAGADPKGITPRETEVLVLVARGLSAKEIALELTMAPRTVDQHIVNLKTKTRARNRAHMVAIALYEGYISF